MAKTKQQDSQPDVDLTNAYTPREVARMLGVKLSTLGSWRTKGVANKPPYVRLSRKVVLYPRAQYDQWAGKQKLCGVD